MLAPSLICLITVALLGHKSEVTQGATTIEVGLPMVIGTALAVGAALVPTLARAAAPRG